MDMVMWGIIACGALSIVYGAWATRSLMAADAGNERMQEIAGAIQEGAKAYLTRQYTAIGITGLVMFGIVLALLGLPVAMGFVVGAVLAAVVVAVGIRSRRGRTARENAWGQSPSRSFSAPTWPATRVA